jgi:type III pantothenate kinase
MLSLYLCGIVANACEYRQSQFRCCSAFFQPFIVQILQNVCRKVVGSMTPQIIPGAVDIGNTRIKIFVGGTLFASGLEENWQEQMQKFFWSFSGKQVALGVSSVNPEAEQLFEQELKKRSNIKSQPLAPLLARQPFVDFSGVSGMGADRQLGLIGALHHDPTLIRPVVTIDCGTAVTVNAVTLQRVCLGGAILPGVRTQLRALHEFTQQLPLVEPASEDATIGANTAQAMLVGVVQGVAGAIRHITERLIERDFHGTEPMLFLAGGDAGIVLHGLKGWFLSPVYEPNLVLRGIEAVMAHSMAEFFFGIGSTRLGG